MLPPQPRVDPRRLDQLFYDVRIRITVIQGRLQLLHRLARRFPAAEQVQVAHHLGVID